MKKIFETKKLFINCFLVLALMLSSGVTFNKAFSANSYNWQRAENEKYTTYIDSINNLGSEDVAFVYIPQRSSELLPQGYLRAMQDAQQELNTKNTTSRFYTLNPYAPEYRVMRSTTTLPAVLVVYKSYARCSVNGSMDKFKLLNALRIAKQTSFGTRFK